MKIIGFMSDKKNRELLLAAAMILLLIMQFQTCNNNKQLKQEVKRSQQIAEQNAAALNETSVRMEQNHAKEMESVRLAFVAKTNDLKNLNKDLYEESKKEIGELKAIIKGQVTASSQPLTISNQLEQYSPTSFGLKFMHTTDRWDIRGVSRFNLINNVLYPDSTHIAQNSVKIDLVLGFKEHNDKYEIFARSPNPDVVINKLDGVLFIAKKPDITCPPQKPQKSLGLGFHLGYGFSSKGIGPVVGIGLNYNLIKF